MLALLKENYVEKLKADKLLKNRIKSMKELIEAVRQKKHLQ